MNGGNIISSTVSDGCWQGPEGAVTVVLERLLQRHDHLGGLATRPKAAAAPPSVCSEDSWLIRTPPGARRRVSSPWRVLAAPSIARSGSAVAHTFGMA